MRKTFLTRNSLHIIAILPHQLVKMLLYNERLRKKVFWTKVFSGATSSQMHYIECKRYFSKLKRMPHYPFSLPG